MTTDRAPTGAETPTGANTKGTILQTESCAAMVTLGSTEHWGGDGVHWARKKGQWRVTWRWKQLEGGKLLACLHAVRLHSHHDIGTSGAKVSEMPVMIEASGMR